MSTLRREKKRKKEKKKKVVGEGIHTKDGEERHDGWGGLIQTRYERGGVKSCGSLFSDLLISLFWHYQGI